MTAGGGSGALPNKFAPPNAVTAHGLAAFANTSTADAQKQMQAGPTNAFGGLTQICMLIEQLPIFSSLRALGATGGGNPTNAATGTGATGNMLSGVQTLADFFCGMSTGTTSTGTTVNSIMGGASAAANTATSNPFISGLIQLGGGPAAGGVGGLITPLINGLQTLLDILCKFATIGTGTLGTGTGPTGGTNPTSLLNGLNQVLTAIEGNPLISELITLGGQAPNLLISLLNGLLKFVNSFAGILGGGTSSVTGLNILTDLQNAIDGLFNSITGLTGSGNTLTGLNNPLTNLLSFLGNPALGTAPGNFNINTVATNFINNILNPTNLLLLLTSPLNALNLFGLIPSNSIGNLGFGAIGGTPPQLLTNPNFDTASSLTGQGIWSWTNTSGPAGVATSVFATANGTLKQLFSNAIPVSAGQVLNLSGYTQWTGFTGGANSIALQLTTYLGGVLQSTQTIGSIASPGATGAWQQLSGTYTVPSSGVDAVKLVPAITSGATAGTVSFGKLSATKTGTMSGSWMSGISGTVAGDLQALTDGVRQGFFGGSSTGNTLSTSNVKSWLSAPLGGLVNAATNTAVDSTTNVAKSNSGNYFNDTFNRTGAAIANGWTVTRTGTGQWATNGTDLYWNGTAIATEFDVCPTAALTDAGVVGVVLDLPLLVSGAVQEIWTRCDGTSSNGVKAQWDGTNISLWKVVSGTATQIGSNVAYTPKVSDYIQIAPVGSTREFIVNVNGTPVIDQTDTAATLSNVGAGFRQGAMYASATATAAPGNLHSVTLHDSTASATVGSGALIYRTSTTNVNSSSGSNLLPTSFFSNTSFSTADITVDLTNNKLTVSKAGLYVVTARIQLANVSVLSGNAMEMLLYKNGSLYQWGAAYFADTTDSTGPTAIWSQFVVQLAANDYVQPGYHGAINANGVFTGEATGAKTFFTIIAASRSGF